MGSRPESHLSVPVTIDPLGILYDKTVGVCGTGDSRVLSPGISWSPVRFSGLNDSFLVLHTSVVDVPFLLPSPSRTSGESTPP